MHDEPADWAGNYECNCKCFEKVSVEQDHDFRQTRPVYLTDADFLDTTLGVVMDNREKSDDCNDHGNSLVFPEKVGSASLRHLHVSLNNLNRLIADIKLRNERNELFYRELIEQSAAGLMSFDESGYIDVMNNAAKRYLGVVQLSNLKLLEQKNPEVHQILTQLKTGEKTVVKTICKKGFG